MSEDQKTYQRGVQASLIGLAIQFTLSIGLLILMLWSSSDILVAAFEHAIGGLLIWICLAIVYQQHKLERIETLEAEQLAQRHGTDNSIFENTADDLAVARKRLDWLYKWIVPGCSLLTAIYLIGRGASILQTNWDRAEGIVIDENIFLGMLTASAGIAFVGFLISRYIAGMAKVPQWQALRGGAAYLMGVVVISILIALSMLLANFGQEGFYRYLIIIIPSLMVIIGCEMAMNFILNFYRPRKQGEITRPAFDSRFLSLLTSPESIAKSISEAVNYQFGFEITRSWFWQLLTRVFGWLCVLGVAVLMAVSCFVTVDTNQNAVVTRMGKFIKVVEPGLEVKLPWPFESVEYYDVTGVRVITISKADPDLPRAPRDPMEANTSREDVVLWGNRHSDDELNLIVAPNHAADFDAEAEEAEAPEPAAPKAEGNGTEKPESIAGKAIPVSIVNAEVLVSYRIDPTKLMQYITANADAQKIEKRHIDDVRARAGWTDGQRFANRFKESPNHHVKRLEVIVARTVSRFLLRNTIDEWIGPASLAAGQQMKKAIADEANLTELGVEIIDVSIAGVHPPQDVATAFHEVVNAQQQRETTIENALQDRIRILVDAAGSQDAATDIMGLINKRDTLRTQNASDEQLDQIEVEIDTQLREAGGQVAVQIAQARAQRWQVENRERGRAEAFKMQLNAYKAAPRLYLARRFLEDMTEGVASTRKFIIAVDDLDLDVRGDFKQIQQMFTVENTDEQ